MGEVAIRANGLGKQYRIGERQKYKALRDTLTVHDFFSVPDDTQNGHSFKAC